jgi:hypothetical protein
MRHATIIIALILFILIPTQALSAAAQLIPCHYLFQVSRIHMVYYRQLDKSILSQGKLRDKKPVFTMLYCPAFEPEEAISVYKTDKGQFVVERLVAKEDIWASFNDELLRRHSSGGGLRLRDIPTDAEFTFPVQFSVHRKEMSAEVALTVGGLFRLAMGQRSVPTATERQEGHYIDGPMELFWLPDETCGLALPEMEPGAGATIVEIGYLLRKYVNDGVSEESILGVATDALSKSNKHDHCAPPLRRDLR